LLSGRVAVTQRHRHPASPSPSVTVTQHRLTVHGGPTRGASRLDGPLTGAE